MILFVRELSTHPIEVTANKRNSLQDSDIIIAYDKGNLYNDAILLCVISLHHYRKNSLQSS